MARSTRYPGADLTKFFGHGGYSGIDQTRLEKIVLHSTETSAKWGCPGYAGGGNAPTFTINPWPGYRKIWQHFDTNESARALLNPTSTPVSENRDGVCQIEIIGYSDARTAKTYGYDLRNLTDDDYAYIGRLVGWIAREWDVPLVTPDLWPSYPASYGNSTARMTSREYDAFTGVLGHLHVSGNSHGDPTIDPAKIIAAAKSPDAPLAPAPKPTTSAKPAAKPATTTTTKAPAFPLPRGYYFGPRSGPRHSVSGYYSHRANLRRWQQRMRDRGWRLDADGLYGPATARVARQFQAEKGLPADSLIGAATWRAAFESPVT